MVRTLTFSLNKKTTICGICVTLNNPNQSTLFMDFFLRFSSIKEDADFICCQSAAIDNLLLNFFQV